MKAELIQNIVQGEGIVTSSFGNTPVLCVNEGPHRFVAASVNFLRCGCRAVQLVFVYRDDDWFEKFQSMLDALCLNEKRIHITFNKETEVALVSWVNE